MDNDDRLRELLATDPAGLTYEQARDGLLLIVQRLEDGQVSLEDSLQLWEKGEELSRRCGEWLDNAQARIDAVMGGDGAPGSGEADATKGAAGSSGAQMPF